MSATATFDFKGVTVMVTGASSGMGRRVAERCADADAAVIACDIAEPPQRRADIEYRRLDVTSEADWQSAIADCLQRYGKLDALVNCAGIIVMGNIVDTPFTRYKEMMAVNIDGTYLGNKHAMKAMLPKGTGSIVNFASNAGIAGSPGASGYCASKGAVRLLTKSVALEAIEAGTRIRVNAIFPGLTDTPMMESIVKQLGGGPELKTALKSLLPGGRLAKTDEIADAVMYLVSDQSSFMNGSEFVVDNGFTAR
jgi:NAD(P)-dependent dehydrogenase (short-subunit alcohol dehydrogenase family)